MPMNLNRILLAFALLTPPTLLAQAYTPPPPPLTTGPCVSTKKNPCPDPPAANAKPVVKDDFPFPGDTPDAGTLPPLDANGEPTGKVIPPKSSAQAPDKFPFPTDPVTPTPGTSSSSSSSSATKPPDDDDDTPLPPPRANAARKKLPKVEDTDTRELKDIDVANFYLTSGNFVGAYNRAKDAVKLYPDDAEAHFVLAQSAFKLKNLYEAHSEYQAYLKLDPDGPHSKAAQKSLDDLQRAVQKP